MNDFAGYRTALNASTDQALAIARDRRNNPEAAYLLPVAEHLAGTVAEQFPEDRALAGRVLMAAGQFLACVGDRLPAISAADLSVIIAFAAEQVVREAPGRRT
jgi:hypothetical protein